MYWLPDCRRRIARVLLILFSLMLVNSVVFRHAHRLASGRIIVHAHPYKPVGNSPYQPNTHTNNELFWLETLSNVLYDGSMPLLFVLAVRPMPVVRVFQVIQTLFFTHYFPFFSHRGPPVVG
ncbi:hypothetical protein [Larkinella soli]|uniref:hypothetical protein n=1 Tax=Larkinella soli TaxID=1770527 RepID=UPI0013E31062|nr:hypothetical protein [Larkinella soli]